ncbi:hypothetical protein GGI09_008566 [Coemansia sp. S100]|nr:hypothetical protein GGI09_008566 [Coemansia sp. S100]KAJ2076658.1 hypothetical protein GGI16_008314 [Coemansia sp. S142-1]
MPPVRVVKVRKPRLLKPTLYVRDYIDLDSVQKCLEDRRSDFVTVDSTTFSGELELDSRPQERFFVLERDHFTLFSHCHAPVKFSYKHDQHKVVEVDGLWQLEQQPVLCFAFGQDADTLRSSYVIDDNTIHEYYESTMTMDMADLATVTQGKADLCVSHFFVVNRGKEYWAVDTKDPRISYTFGPSTKTRTISRLADGSITVQALIDKEHLQASIDAGTSQSPKFTLRDINGEEVVEGNRFVLQIPGRGDDDDDDDNEDPMDIPDRYTMFDEKDWVSAFYSTHLMPRREAMLSGSMDNGSCFGVTVVDDITYLTFEGLFVQIENHDRSSNIIVLPETPSKCNRIHLTYSDDGLIALSRWGAKVPITLEWVKSSCGVYSTDEDSSFEHSTKLRIIKV